MIIRCDKAVRLARRTRDTGYRPITGYRRIASRRELAGLRAIVERISKMGVYLSHVHRMATS